MAQLWFRPWFECYQIDCQLPYTSLWKSGKSYFCSIFVDKSNVRHQNYRLFPLYKISFLGTITTRFPAWLTIKHLSVTRINLIWPFLPRMFRICVSKNVLRYLAILVVVTSFVGHRFKFRILIIIIIFFLTHTIISDGYCCVH